MLPCCGLNLHCCPPCLLCDMQQMTRAECSALPVLPCCNPRPGPLVCACASHQHFSNWAAGPGCQCAQYHWKFRQGLDWLYDCIRPTACAASAPTTTCPATALQVSRRAWPESIPPRLISNTAACALRPVPSGSPAGRWPTELWFQQPICGCWSLHILQASTSCDRKCLTAAGRDG